MVMLSSTLKGRVLKFHTAAYDPNTLYVVSLAGQEAISRPYPHELELLSTRSDLDSAALLRNSAWIGIKRGVTIKGSDKRGIQTIKIHGAVCEFEQCERSHEYIAYRAILVPRLWNHSMGVQSRIFLDKSVPQIVEVSRDVAAVLLSRPDAFIPGR